MNNLHKIAHSILIPSTLIGQVISHDLDNSNIESTNIKRSTLEISEKAKQVTVLEHQRNIKALIEHIEKHSTDKGDYIENITVRDFKNFIEKIKDLSIVFDSKCDLLEKSKAEEIQRQGKIYLENLANEHEGINNLFSQIMNQFAIQSDDQVRGEFNAIMQEYRDYFEKARNVAMANAAATLQKRKPLLEQEIRDCVTQLIEFELAKNTKEVLILEKRIEDLKLVYEIIYSDASRKSHTKAYFPKSPEKLKID